MANRTLTDLSKRVLRETFELGQRLGVDFLPRHFYSEIPDIRLMRRDRSWRAPFSMIGVRGAAIESQLEHLRSWVTPSIARHLREVDVFEAACAENGAVGFGRIEADLLFAFVASQKPAHIFQVGCGVSTAVCVAAARFAGYQPRITCVDPYPTGVLQRLAAAGSIDLIPERVQSVPLSRLEALGNDTLFFVDSSHTLGPAGEVSRIILEMLPRLKVGSRVHFHDIYFPYDYGRSVLREALFFQHESVLLHAFLAFNSRFSVLASCSMLHYGAPAELRDALPNYRPAPNDDGLSAGTGHFPSSIYIQTETG
ncbi:MAG TPA: class I SAM-dependent methyltransferase [Steroidobacteraceae bacterium]|nr:class I SAM-dependent methyltransferase [Steroidobacteraceae bacterium]